MPKVLISSQDDVARQSIVKNLRSLEYQVHSGVGFRGLLEAIESVGPDVVLLDIYRERDKGLEMLIDIRNRHYDLPIILLSVCDTTRCDPRVMAANYLVFKPMDIEEIKAKILMAMESNAPISMCAAS